jgi:hypothetical protein
MDRRDFLKSLFSSSLLVPLLDAGPADGELACYLIGDRPERYLLALIETMADKAPVPGGGFSFLNPHPFGTEIGRALSRNGWVVSSPSAARLVLSFAPLRHRAAPSFTLIRDAEIQDLRGRGLRRLWEEMNASDPTSACLTVASLRPLRRKVSPGREVNVHAGGRRKETLSLAKDQRKRYPTPSGEIVVAIEGGTARVLEAACRHKICQATWPISRSGERIICAPGRFLLEIEGPGLVDTVTG